MVQKGFLLPLPVTGSGMSCEPILANESCDRPLGSFWGGWWAVTRPSERPSLGKFTATAADGNCYASLEGTCLGMKSILRTTGTESGKPGILTPSGRH